MPSHWETLQQREMFAGAAIPTPSQIGAMWFDTTTSEWKYATSISPVVFVVFASPAGPAPATASYVVMGLDGVLVNERVLTAGSNIGIVDGGPGGAVTINLGAHAATHAAIGADPVDHNTLLNFVANRHIDHSAVTITGINGLTGGGDITLSRTLEPGYAGTILGLANANSNGVANEIARSDHQHKRDVRVASAGVDVGTRNRLNFIAGANISYIFADDAGADEIDITIAAAGGGGSVDIKAATITAPYNSYDYSEIIVDVAVLAASQIMLGWGATSVDDENTPDMEDINFQAVADPAGGQFTAFISASSNNAFGGPFKLNYLIG